MKKYEVIIEVCGRNSKMKLNLFILLCIVHLIAGEMQGEMEASKTFPSKFMLRTRKK